MLNFLRSFRGENVKKLVPTEFKKDVNWWRAFLLLYNGVSMMAMEELESPDSTFATDACLTGCGGVTHDQYFHCRFPKFIRDRNLHINELEMLTISVAVKLWGHLWFGKRLVIYGDNLVSVLVMNYGKTRNVWLQSCLKEILFFAAKYGFEIRAKHICGVENRAADWLSRWDV